ncbi:MAG TPA: glycosyltransferase family 4 protein [Candidatus Paceibacterota bacterium]|nr:glycosyltransferase family 4 protein [Candidatus Paceibacterota bacterium]HRZ34656.1 glycosyltransferase family 4 protein [Candidatus Paceibacterota bacterium]
MKKILMLNYEFPPLGGGAGNATYYLLKEFAKDPDLEIDLVTSSVNEFKVEQFSKNIKIHFLDIGKRGNLHYQSNKDLLFYSWRAYRYAKKLMKQNKFDLCHAFFGIPCGYIAMKLGLPYIVSLRGSDVPFYNKRFYWLDKLIFKSLSKKVWKRAKSVIANSEDLKNLAFKTALKQDIGVIYNGVDLEEFKPTAAKVQSKNLRLISTGRLIERKGYEYSIRAISGMKNVVLTLVGDGNLAPRLKSLAKECNSNVNFVGKKEHSEIVSLLQQSDVFVLPSLNEGMSNSILEAMAVGLPIIATNTGGSAELVKDNGFVVSMRSAEELKGAIEMYNKDAELLKRQSSASLFLAAKIDWANAANKYKQKYL